ncbi:hypothetical protein GWI33_011533 [Rhynchophorus ferrugineus]|uniref:Uncharacterized protein n=1 Tax=Rhynchophorus ferrugineus TaxID=354439 RepID=A0A834J1K6_RHYFE|nr:hypothetical protein GWI33_011533 [Rhynchophorus ferrugineus]
MRACIYAPYAPLRRFSTHPAAHSGRATRRRDEEGDDGSKLRVSPAKMREFDSGKTRTGRFGDRGRKISPGFPALRNADLAQHALVWTGVHRECSSGLVWLSLDIGPVITAYCATKSTSFPTHFPMYHEELFMFTAERS